MHILYFVKIVFNNRNKIHLKLPLAVVIEETPFHSGIRKTKASPSPGPPLVFTHLDPVLPPGEPYNGQPVGHQVASDGGADAGTGAGDQGDSADPALHTSLSPRHDRSGGRPRRDSRPRPGPGAPPATAPGRRRTHRHHAHAALIRAHQPPIDGQVTPVPGNL